MLKIPYFRPSLDGPESEAVARVISSGWLTTGHVTKEFESEFASYVGAKHAVAVNSCTAALHLALEAAGVGPGDIVIVPAMTFTATAAAVRYLGARPVLVDCDPVTLCIDPDDVERAAESWRGRGPIRAVLAVHYGGQMADVDRLHRIAARYGATLIEDAAHALPAFTRSPGGGAWRSVGSTSKLTCFSFYANKCITTGEGGMAVTDDEEMAERMRMMSLHGLSRNAWQRFSARYGWRYEVEELGFKYNMTDIAAAIGLAQLKKADGFMLRRRAIAERYNERLDEFSKFIETPVEIKDRRSSWHIYAIRLRLENLGVDRDEFTDRMNRAGVGCSVHWMPLHLHAEYRRTYGCRPEDCPTATAEWERLVSLPIFPSMTEREIDYVCETVSSILADCGARKAAAACA